MVEMVVRLMPDKVASRPWDQRRSLRSRISVRGNLFDSTTPILSPDRVRPIALQRRRLQTVTSSQLCIQGYALDIIQRNLLIERHLARIRRIASDLSFRFRGRFHVEDLVQVAVLALIEASQRYKEDAGCSWWAFVRPRCYGSMLNFIDMEINGDGPESRERHLRLLSRTHSSL